MPIKAIVFDIDNTLVDFHTMKLQCTEAGVTTMVQRGLPATLEEVKRIVPEVFRNYGWEDQLLFWHIAEFAGVKDETALERFAQLGKTSYRRKQRDFLKPYEGVAETLAALREQGVQLAILSDAPRLKVFDRLCDAGLEPFFENNVVGAINDTHKKPNSEAFRKVLSLLGRTSPQDVLMVGDHPVRDILGAKNYGFSTAWAKYGYIPQHGEDPNTVKTRADHVLERFSDLLHAVRTRP